MQNRLAVIRHRLKDWQVLGGVGGLATGIEALRLGVFRDCRSGFCKFCVFEERLRVPGLAVCIKGGLSDELGSASHFP